MAHLVALKRTLMKIGREHLPRNFLKAFLGCSTDERHGRQPLRKPCPFSFTVIHCVLANLFDEPDGLDGRNGFEEGDLMQISNVQRQRYAHSPH